MNAFLKRILGEKSNFFKITIKDSDKRYYKVFSVNRMIYIEAESKPSAGLGLYRYLKDFLHVNYSWCGNTELKIDELVFDFDTIYEEIQQKYISIFNYCTYGYSMAYWNFDKFEKMLDFMLLNGVNLPLFVVGIEAVWYQVLIKNNFTKEEALKFISSPSHFPWQLMTNLEGVMPPMSEDYIFHRLKLGQKIMKRMLELGMTPIQMGFSGFVPELFKTKYFKGADIRQKGNWCGIRGTYELNPKDPLFKKIGTDFLNTEKELFGAHHFYACDPFHESEPPINTKEYLVDVSNSIQDMYEEFDKNYTWVMQSWSIREDIVKAIPKEKLLILDLAGIKHESTDYFWGYNYLTGQLHNFGGRINMHGDIKLLTQNKFMDLKSRSNCVGTGIFMEGINQNPLYYDLALKMLSSSGKIDLDEFLSDYCLRRYGVNDNILLNAIRNLSETVYKEGTNGVEKSSMICARPALNVKKSGPNKGFEIPYKQNDLIKILDDFLSYSSQKLKDGYFFDIYDIARQVGSNALQTINNNIKKSYIEKDTDTFYKETDSFLNLLKLIDELLLTRNEYNLYSELNLAKKYTDNAQVNDYLVKAYKTLLTIWADIDNPQIFDYSWREWGGLIGNFYYVRWQMFFEFLGSEITKDNAYSLETENNLEQCYGREAFYANDIYKKIGNFEINWINETYKIKNCLKDNNKTLIYAKKILSFCKAIN